MNIETIKLFEPVNPLDYVNAHYILAVTNAADADQMREQIDCMKELMEHVPVPYIVTGLTCAADARDWLKAGAVRIYVPGPENRFLRDLIEQIGEERILTDLNDIPERNVAFCWDELKLNSDGMIPVVVQDHLTNEVLMVAYMNRESYEATLRTGHMVYYSRSRQELWEKGLTSGHLQFVKSLHLDCDNDTILAKVAQIGAACHTGSYSCFFKTILAAEFTD